MGFTYPGFEEVRHPGREEDGAVEADGAQRVHQRLH